MIHLDADRRFHMGIRSLMAMRILLEKGTVMDGVLIDGAGDVYFTRHGEKYRINGATGDIEQHTGWVTLANREELRMNHYNPKVEEDIPF